MIHPDTIINDINKKVHIYFDESTFVLKKSGYKYISSGNYVTYAHNSRSEIKVIKWLLDFWIYVEIEFRRDTENKIYHIFFSMSVFKGRDNDRVKKQLFRAEWDSYDNNVEHPQPHWHFYTDDQKVFSSFHDMVANEKQSGFEEMLSETGINKIDKFHFAMNALWHHDEGHIHKIDTDKKFIQWFIGLLSHIKTQLEYISK